MRGAIFEVFKASLLRFLATVVSPLRPFALSPIRLHLLIDTRFVHGFDTKLCTASRNALLSGYSESLKTRCKPILEVPAPINSRLMLRQLRGLVSTHDCVLLGLASSRRS